MRIDLNIIISFRFICVVMGGGLISGEMLRAQDSSVSSSNAFGSSSSNGGGGGGGGGTPPEPETFAAAFTLQSSGKQIKANCAACHNLEIKVGDRTLKDGETGTFRKGKEYPVSIIDKPVVNRPNATVPPDHDTAKFTVWPLAVDGQTVTKSDDDKVFFVGKDAVVQYLIDNDDLLFAQYKDWTDTLLSKSARLLPVEVAVDNNRNGEITFGGEDETTAEEPYRFWINNDNDHQSNSNEDHPWTDSPDHESAAIESRRDLEDFARLHFMIGGLHESFADGSMQLGVKWKETTEGSPSIRLFEATDEEGGLSYLKKEAAADTQKAENAIGTVSGGGTLTLPQAITSELSSADPNLYFIYEGLSEGKGELAFVIIKDGEELGEVGGLHLHFTDVRRMFERVKATPEQIDDPGLYRGSSSPPALNMGWNDDPWNYPFEEAWDEDTENKKYVVFVHGWRMTYRGSRSFGITMFKRLWWENFKGRYSAFRWLTYASEQDHLGFTELEGQSKEALQAYLSKYNHSEYRAWKSGISLKKYMESLPSDYSKNLVAHSMGNIVGGSALREGLAVKNYALLQAAVPATCYDGRNDLYQNPSQLILPVGGLNIPFLLWDFPMVGDDSVAAIRAMGYKEQIKNVSGNLVNFYLPDDEATSFAWEFNNSVDKPVAVPGPHPIHYSYFYEPNPPAGATSKLWVAPPARVMTEAHESMAMIDRSKTKAVGAEGRTQGSIDSSINLDTEFGFGEEHSAEFERDIQRVGEFYKRLKNELEREE
jgi:hypothetical protein